MRLPLAASLALVLVACAARPSRPQAVQHAAPFERACIEGCKEDDSECAIGCELDLTSWQEAPSQSAWCHRKGFSCTDTPGERIEWLGGVRADGTTWRR